MSCQNIFHGYTKHYYAGTERVASKIGGGGIADITTPIVSTDYKRNSWTQPYASLWSSCLNLAAPCSTFFYSLLNAQTVQSPETALYFYHSDHLGSASWITDSSGSAIQHLQYLPFGETRIDQRATNWSTRYSFSAKEKDEESQYSYFGARYYDSELSIWLSVDPMASKYPSLTPYNYCANNPIKLVDPDGRAHGPADRIAFARLFIGDNYKQQTETPLRTQYDAAAMQYQDCSELVCRVLGADQITNGVKHMNTKGLEILLFGKVIRG